MVIKANYKKATAKYIRVKKTLKRILRTYYFLKIRKTVQQYIANYNIYWKLKHLKYKFYREMKKSEIFKEVWKSIIANFIIKLLLSKNSITGVIYNSALIIIDRFIKYVYFIFYLETAIAKDFIYIFLRNIFVNYRILEKITLDWDKLFIFKFWKSLTD